ncbi:MAG TPA: class I SAM-dependent methyltransferase [Ruminiclostridium sp.]|nr:class I SAM-dependent methyltransferase [Ruminiclostridium sp.]
MDNSCISKMKIPPCLENVQKTLLLPLWGRAEASRMQEPVIVDLKAIELINSMDYDFTKFRQNLDFFHIITLAVRAHEFDSLINNFLKNHETASIVNIGAGLDTTFSRISGSNVHWYNIDMPDVIELRKKLIPETTEMEEIPKSMFDESFVYDIKEPDNTLFIIGGVLMYFDESEVRRFFDLISTKFKGAEVVFDVLSPFGIHYFNRLLKKTGFDNAQMKWGTKNYNDIECLNQSLKIVERYPFYSRVKKRNTWPLTTRLKIFVSNLLSMAGIVHLQIN